MLMVLYVTKVPYKSATKLKKKMHKLNGNPILIRRWSPAGRWEDAASGMLRYKFSLGWTLDVCCIEGPSPSVVVTN